MSDRPPGKAALMLLFFSSRLRRWLFAVLVLPLFGRLLQTVGTRVQPARPRAGRVLTDAGELLTAGRRRRRR